MQFGEAQNPFRRGLPWAVRALLIVTIGIFLVQTIVDANTGGAFTRMFGLSLEDLLAFRVWQVVSYMFLHDRSLWHILVNMLVLYFFGCEMEEILGTRRFLKLYLGCGIVAGVGWVLITAAMGRSGYCIGASGAVFGIMGAFAAMFPDRMITLLLFFVLPVTMSARTMIIGLGIVSLVLLIISDGNIAHAAHLTGGIAGWVYGVRISRNPALLAGGDRGAEGGAGSRWVSNVRAFFARRRTRVAADDKSSPTSEEVDRLLDKISATGIGSLSDHERKTLEKAASSGTRRPSGRGRVRGGLRGL
jgi:membrane associated rhomboid family serine protease